MNGKDGFRPLLQLDSSTRGRLHLFTFPLRFGFLLVFKFSVARTANDDGSDATMAYQFVSFHLPEMRHGRRLSSSLTRTFSRRICFFTLPRACLKQQISHYKFCAESSRKIFCYSSSRSNAWTSRVSRFRCNEKQRHECPEADDVFGNNFVSACLFGSWLVNVARPVLGNCGIVAMPFVFSALLSSGEMMW